MAKLGEKSICSLCKQEACVKMSVFVIEEMCVFTVPGDQNKGFYSVSGFTRNPVFVIFPFWCPFHPEVLALAGRKDRIFLVSHQDPGSQLFICGPCGSVLKTN